MLKEVSDVAAPLIPAALKYCSQDNLPDPLSACDPAGSCWPKVVDTNKQSAPQGAHLHAAYAATRFPTSVTHKPLKHHLEMPYRLSTICYPLPRRRCRSV